MEYKIEDLTFAEEIETICREKKVEYIDAIINWCNEKNIDIELIANHIKKDIVLKSKIQAEAENLNYFKKGAKLPI